MPDPVELDLSAQSEWMRMDRPFRHILVRNLFTEATYLRLTAEFQKVLDATFSGGEGRSFARPKGNYDAWMLEVRDGDGFQPFFDQSWMERVAQFLGVPSNGLIDGALHHVPAQSRSGYIHTDFCSAWFDRVNETDAPRFPRRDLTQYFTGRRVAGAARPVEYVRSCTMIYYLYNAGWHQGAGGETALFSDMQGRGPCVKIPPHDNSLLVFECMPHSYHALQATVETARNSIILWLHCSVEEAERRWPNGCNRRSPR